MQYLQIWLGLVGSHVGLHLPKDLVLDMPDGCEGLIGLGRRTMANDLYPLGYLEERLA